ncbi:MAG: response regulator transcription factor [Bacteroidota bacterium]
MTDNTDSIKKFDRVINVGVVDDHLLFRSGMVSLLGNFDEVKVVLEASNGRDLLEQLDATAHRSKNGKNNLPDVLLLDLQMPEMNGIQTTVFLQEEYPAVKIIILTMHNEEEFIFDLLNKGANGFLAKDKTVETVMDAITSVMNDGMYVNEQILKAIVRGSQRKNHLSELSPKTPGLTEREIEIIQLICEQKTNKEIADFFQLSTRTVENHRVAILAKTGVKNMAGLVLYAIKYNLINVKNASH